MTLSLDNDKGRVDGLVLDLVVLRMFHIDVFTRKIDVMQENCCSRERARTGIFETIFVVDHQNRQIITIIKHSKIAASFCVVVHVYTVLLMDTSVKSFYAISGK